MRFDARELRFEVERRPDERTATKERAFDRKSGGRGRFSRGYEDAEGIGLKPLSHKDFMPLGNPRMSPFSGEESED